MENLCFCFYDSPGVALISIILREPLLKPVCGENHFDRRIMLFVPLAEKFDPVTETGLSHSVDHTWA